MSDGGMQMSLREEGLSEAFLRAIASMAGYALAKPLPDNDGVDFTISKSASSDPDSNYENPRLDIQLKATYQDIIVGDYLKYQLPIHNYRKLSNSRVCVPRILVLLHLPRDKNQWLSHIPHESLSLHNCCYYLSLRGSREVENRTTVQVEIPRNNVFSVDSLNAMMEKIERDGHL